MGSNLITKEEKNKNRDEFIAIWFLNNPNWRKKKVYSEKSEDNVSVVPMAFPVKKKDMRKK